MKNKFSKTISFFILLIINVGSLQAQAVNACDLTDVSAINKILNTALTYDLNINKPGKFECRYTDPKIPGRFVAVGLLQAKIEYGYDVLKTESETSQKSIAEGKKVSGKFVHFFPYPKGGPTSYYMTAPKDDFSGEAVIFKFRKDNFIISFSTENIESGKVIEKLDEIYKLLSLKSL